MFEQTNNETAFAESLKQLSTTGRHAAGQIAAGDDLTSHQVAALKALVEDGKSANTERSYETGARYWAAWHYLTFGRPLEIPTPVNVVAAFIADHIEHWPNSDAPIGAPGEYLLPTKVEDQLVEFGFKRTRGPWKLNTVEQRISVLAAMHSKSQAMTAIDAPQNPCQHAFIKQLLKQIRRAHAKRNKGPSKRRAATRDKLQCMLDQIASNSLRDIRDRAVLLVGFSAGGRRRTEISNMVYERIERRDYGYLWRLGVTKTDREGKGKSCPIKSPAADALTAWMEAAGTSSGPVFLEIGLDGKLTGRPMSDQAVYRMVKRVAASAGLGESGWGAHSLRGGFMTQAGRDNLPLAETMQASGHKSPRVALGYYEEGQLENSTVSEIGRKILVNTDPSGARIVSARGRRKKEKLKNYGD